MCRSRPNPHGPSALGPLVSSPPIEAGPTEAGWRGGGDAPTPPRRCRWWCLSSTCTKVPKAPRHACSWIAIRRPGCSTLRRDSSEELLVYGSLSLVVPSASTLSLRPSYRSLSLRTDEAGMAALRRQFAFHSPRPQRGHAVRALRRRGARTPGAAANLPVLRACAQSAGYDNNHDQNITIFF